MDCAAIALDTNNEKNGIDPLGDGGFRTTVIINPPGGWGTDLVRELGGTRVGVFSDFKSTNPDYVLESEFRQVGIVSDVEPTAEGIPDSLSVIEYLSDNVVFI